MQLNRLVDKCNWSLLRIFRVIVQEGSLNKAAIKLNITQSAVSQNLKNLEEQIGERLVVRNRGEFYLTPAGEIIFAASLKVYSDLMEYEQKVRQQSNIISGTIKLLVLSRIQSSRFDQLMYDFHMKYPQVDFQVDVLKSTEILQLLQQKIPALGICLSATYLPKLNYMTLLNQQYALFCGQKHRLFDATVNDINDIKDQGYIAFQSDQLNDVNSPLNEARAQILQNNRLLVTTNNIDEVIRFIKSGLGIGFLPKHIIEHKGRNKLYKQLPPFPHAGLIPIYLAWHKERELSLVEQYFVNDLRNVYQTNN